MSKKILTIETSCDETAAAVLSVSPPSPHKGRSGLPSEALAKEGERLFPKITTLSSVVKSQIKLHAKMGGVVPEVAARAHVKNILPVVEKAIENSKLKIENLDYIAVTQGPGLIPSLIVGVEFAKALSLATGKPIIPVNHMMGHLYSPFSSLQANTYKLQALFPMISLIVSGGHTMLVLLKNIGDYKVLGQTVDDAAGEAFDKVAKLLKLPYPGGPQVSKLAEKGKANFIFPRPMINSKDYNFSFSGLKTAVLYHVQSLPATSYNLQAKRDVCKAFQDAAVDVLVTKTVRAAKQFKAKSISLSGGVAANKALRESLQATSYNLQTNFFVPPLNLCTDNAEMIGLAAAFMLNSGYKPKFQKNLQADSNLQL